MSGLLEAEDVRVHFGGVKAVDGVTLQVEQGALLGLIGPNGSGKSTLLGAISRLTDVTGGRLRFNGVDYTQAPAHTVSSRGIARTFQTVRLLRGRTVLENVMVGAGSDAVARGPLRHWVRPVAARRLDRTLRAKAEDALARVGIQEHGRAYADDLPYGLQRKVEIARALACDPTLLLLDEPTAGMNQHERGEIGDLLMSLHAEGLTQILVEHDLGMMHRVCSTAAALDFGKLITTGDSREVVEHPLVREAYLGRSASRASSAVEVASRE